MSNIDIFIDEAIKNLDDRRDNYDIIKDKVIKLLTDELNKSEIMYVNVFGRSKDSNGLREKIYRKNYAQKYSNDANKFIDELQDGIGVRIVCFMNDDEARILEILQNSFRETSCVNNRKFNHSKENNFFICFENQPEKQKNGLDIYRMDAFYQDSGNKPVNMEIQIKSLTNYFWGELEHKLFYKNYNYTISNGFFEGLMMNIHKELNNIDSEMAMLQSHLAKDGNEERLELHQIAALMISKKYEPEIQDILKCKIDLREVYSLIVDLLFGLTKDEKENRNTLSELLQKLTHSSNIASRFESIISETYTDSEITENNKKIGEVIHKNISSGDVFWISFYIIYENLCKIQADTYSKIINRIADQIRSLYRDVADAADALGAFENIYVDKIIDNVMINVMETTNKLSNFSIEYRLTNIKDALKTELMLIQNEIIIDLELDEQVFNDNITIISNILYIVAMVSIHERIPKTVWTRLLNEEVNNDYALALPDDVTEYIRNTKQLSSKDNMAFLNIYTKE